MSVIAWASLLGGIAASSRFCDRAGGSLLPRPFCLFWLRRTFSTPLQASGLLRQRWELRRRRLRLLCCELALLLRKRELLLQVQLLLCN